MIDNIKLSPGADAVVIVDQTRLPREEVYLELREAEELYRAIFELQVRGAPAIGIFAGYALYVLARSIGEKDFQRTLREQAAYLGSARPTAVNLSWALDRMLKTAAGHRRDKALKLMYEECCQIQQEDVAVCRAIAEYGLTLVKDGDGILTHCNAGPLATSRYGTGLGALILGQERGYRFKVFCDETRPLLQGARLTAYELMEAGIDTTLICDNMAGMVMQQGRLQACFVGCDRVAANGDTANKVGTSSVAVLAAYYKVPFYVFCPTSTIDLRCRTGKDIVIEERSGEEIYTKYFEKPTAPEGVKCYNPAFDVTENSLITAIVTEKGICRAPYTDSLKRIMR